MPSDMGAMAAMMSGPAFWRPDDIRKSSWTQHVPFAFWLVDAMRPRSIVELGTWNGMSYLAFCQAVRTLGLAATATGIDTWMGDHQAGRLQERALDSLRGVHDPRYGGFSRLMQATFDDARATFADGSIDLLHIDGLHTYDAVKHDFETWLPKMSERGVILFHDTQETHDDFGVYRLWAEIRGEHPSFEFTHEHGLGVLAVGPDVPPGLTPLFDAAHDEEQRQSIRAMFSRLGEGVRSAQTEIELRESLNRYRYSPPARLARGVRNLVKRGAWA